MTIGHVGIFGERSIALLLGALLAFANVAYADKTLGEGTVVLGPTANTRLQDGAGALKVGRAEDGIELTRAGLKDARSKLEVRTAFSNLCAGYLMLEKLDQALLYCNEALEIDDRSWRVYNNRALIYVLQRRFDDAEADLAKCEELHPKARQTKVVKQMLRQAKNPVEPVITIDDRRNAPLAEQEDE